MLPATGRVPQHQRGDVVAGWPGSSRPPGRCIGGPAPSEFGGRQGGLASAEARQSDQLSLASDVCWRAAGVSPPPSLARTASSTTSSPIDALSDVRQAGHGLERRLGRGCHRPGSAQRPLRGLDGGGESRSCGARSRVDDVVLRARDVRGGREHKAAAHRQAPTRVGKPGSAAVAVVDARPVGGCERQQITASAAHVRHQAPQDSVSTRSQATAPRSSA